MRKVFENINYTQIADVNLAIRQLGSGKPYLHFNSDIQFCGCNDVFNSVFKISKSKLFASNLIQDKKNKQFFDALSKARSEKTSTFHGNVLLGTGLSETYLDALIINIETGKENERGIFCFILENVSQDAQYDAERVSSETTLPGCLNASVSVHTRDGIAIYISPSTEAMLGYSNTEIKELGSLNLVHPDDLPVVKEALGKLNTGFDFLTTRYRMVHKNGSILFVETTSYILGDTSGNTNHIVNITSDLGSHQGIQQALKISEQKYYRLVMNLPVGVSLISATGKLLEVNATMKKIMRIPSDFPILELNFLNIEGMKRSGLCDLFRKCIEAKEDVNGEIKIKLSRKSRDSYLAYSFVPIFDQSGEVESVIGYVNDLTKQKKAESDNRERADFLNLVINTIKTPFFVKDEEHRWVILNDAAVEMMGQSRDALMRKTDYDIYPKEQADVFWKYDELVFKSGSSSNEEQITWSDGTIHTIVTYKQLYIEKPSGKKFIVGTIHDITSYKKIEEELRASNTKYRELFDNANDFILTTDINGNITNANRKLLKYLQTDLGSLSQHNVFEYIREDDIDFANKIKNKLLSGESGESFDLKAYGVDRQDVIYEVKASLIRQGGGPVGVQCVFSDITERREASLKLEKFNESLVELNATKDKFFRIIAHDLRNPYSSMIGFAEMLLEDLDDLTKDEIRDSLKIIYNSAKNSFSLLENLLAWSRLETGHIPFVQVPVILTSLVEEVVNVLFSLAYRKRIEINNLVKPDVELFADKNMISTILNNLIMNAIKFTYPGGKVDIYATRFPSETESGSDFIKISVADNGIGMDAEAKERLFTSNRMESVPGTEKEQGTGLGLIITREMVEKHGGKIMVESSPDKGSVFSFLIPANKPEMKS